MIETINLFDTKQKSKESIIPNDLDSIRSTLFGKFYESIVAKWIVEKEKYFHCHGKPCVYWENIPLSKQELQNGNFSKILFQKVESNIREKKVRTNSDGLFSKNDSYYLWEAKNWAKWTGGKKSVKIQVTELLQKSAWLLAKKVKLKKGDLPLSGIFFSWWQRFPGARDLEDEITKSIELPFKIYFTCEILDDCRRQQYDWYKKLVNEQYNNIDSFFKELLSY